MRVTNREGLQALLSTLLANAAHAGEVESAVGLGFDPADSHTTTYQIDGRQYAVTVEDVTMPDELHQAVEDWDWIEADVGREEMRSFLETVDSDGIARLWAAFGLDNESPAGGAAGESDVTV